MHKTTDMPELVKPSAPGRRPRHLEYRDRS